MASWNRDNGHRARRTLLFYCQHSLGLGHLTRSMALSEALSRRFRVVLLCGGKLPRSVRIPDGVEVAVLPPLGAAMNGNIVSRDGRRSVQQAREARGRMILQTFRSLRPAVVLIEFFPFGKKRFASELIPLLDLARVSPNSPYVVCSIRDILVGRGSEQQEHDDRACELLNRYFDAVLVHSDPAFARLEDSFHPRAVLRTPVHYTGFVVPNGTHPNGTRGHKRGIVVSAGGGIVGEPLLRAVVQAHRLIRPIERPGIKLIAGPFLPEDAYRSLGAEVRDMRGLTLRRAVPDLLSELRSAAASISQCGYNTAFDILQARVPALVVPFADGGEDEQTKRARRLRELGAVRLLEPAALGPEAVAAELRALPDFRPRPLDLDLGGGPASARLLADLCYAPAGERVSSGGS